MIRSTSRAKSTKLSRETAHLVRPVPVLSLIAALLRIKARREEKEQLQLFKVGLRVEEKQEVLSNGKEQGK